MDISLIEDGLFQGAMTDEEPPPGVDVVVNVRRTPNNFRASVGLTALLHFPIVDHAFPGISWLDMVVDCISACRSRGKSLLVHCASGQSRSSLVVIGCLMKSLGIGREAALAMVVAQRPCADPNHRFWDGLAEYELYLRSNR